MQQSIRQLQVVPAMTAAKISPGLIARLHRVESREAPGHGAAKTCSGRKTSIRRLSRRTRLRLSPLYWYARFARWVEAQSPKTEEEVRLWSIR